MENGGGEEEKGRTSHNVVNQECFYNTILVFHVVEDVAQCSDDRVDIFMYCASLYMTADTFALFWQSSVL